jgi:hypothetical protein
VLTYLAKFPDRTEVVAKLLARVLVHRPIRLRAMRALRVILEDLAKNDEQAKERVSTLGAALRAWLDPGEREALETEFPIVVSRKNKDIGPLVAALLNALSVVKPRNLE